MFSRSVRANYEVWSREGGSSHIIYIAAGVEDSAQIAYRVPAYPGVFPGVPGNTTLSLTAPTDRGTYTIYVLLAAENSELSAKNAYTQAFSLGGNFLPLATIHVE